MLETFARGESTVDAPWDSAGNESRLRADQDGSYYARMYAWRDPEGGESALESYRLPHHEVGEDGEIGAANVGSCIAAIAVLNGARGGITIPEEDRAKVYRHLYAHLRDAGVRLPDIKRFLSNAVERRAFSLDGIEVRAEQDGTAPLRLVGHAAVFDQEWDGTDLWGYSERIARGAFRKTIQESDVRALWNHDANYVLGRTKSGTLKLREDDYGLAVEIFPPDVQWSRDLLESIRRGDVSQMSFAFQVVKESVEGTAADPVRVLQEVRLFDVSPVTFPAYSMTDVHVRSLLDLLQRYAAVEPLVSGHSEEPPLVGHSGEPSGDQHSAEEGADGDNRYTVQLARLRLELADRQ